MMPVSTDYLVGAQRSQMIQLHAYLLRVAQQLFTAAAGEAY